jgi:hypothetical protein
MTGDSPAIFLHIACALFGLLVCFLLSVAFMEWVSAIRESNRHERWKREQERLSRPRIFDGTWCK